MSAPRVPPPLRPEDTVIPGQVLSTHEVLQLGITYGRLALLVRKGLWRRIIPGFYTPTAPAGQSPEWSAMAIAGQRAFGSQAVVGLSSAARLHGEAMVSLLQPTLDQDLHLIMSALAPKRRQPTVLARDTRIRLHWRQLAEHEVTTLQGVRVTTPARTVRDLLPTLDRVRGVCLLDAALEAGWLSHEQLPDLRKSLAHTPGARHIPTVIAWARLGAQSPLETRMRLACQQAGLPPDQLQLPVIDRGRLLGYADMAWSRGAGTLIVECDGKKYHDVPEALYKDRFRHNNFQVAGYMMLRVTWSDALNPAQAIHTIRRALSSLSHPARPRPH